MAFISYCLASISDLSNVIEYWLVEDQPANTLVDDDSAVDVDVTSFSCFYVIQDVVDDVPLNDLSLIHI